MAVRVREHICFKCEGEIWCEVEEDYTLFYCDNIDCGYERKVYRVDKILESKNLLVKKTTN